MSLTGFKLNDFIVTDRMVCDVERCEEVVFQFMEIDGCSIAKKIILPFKEFQNRINQLVTGNENFSIIEFDLPEIKSIRSLIFDLQRNTEIGSPIALLGYNADSENLCIKNGLVSSFFKIDDDKKFIQFESSIKLGNSGSPILDLNTGNVIGMVGYRLATLTKAYDGFKKIINENLRILKQSEGKMNILDIDPIQVLVANQNQLKQLCKTFYNSSSISFGYACEIKHITKYVTDEIAIHPVNSSL